MKSRVCTVCGKVFEPKSPTQLRCSPECSREHERKMSADRQRAYRAERLRTLKKTCVVCGAAFETRSSKKICCSRECAHSHYRELSRRGSARRRDRERNGVIKTDPRKVYDADGKHRRFRMAAMKREPWKYEFADSPEMLS